MSIGDCLAKVGVDPHIEDAILRGVDGLMSKKRMSEALAAERVLKNEMKSVDAEHADLVKQIEVNGGKEQLALAKHVEAHGEIDTTPRESKPLPDEKPLQAKEASDHVEARKADIKDVAKDVVGGSPAADSHIESAIKKGPQETRALIDAINKTKAKGREQVARGGEALDRLNKAMGEKTRDNPDTQYSLMREHGNVDEKLTADQTARAAVGDYINKVLGDHVKVLWEKMTHAGDFTFTKGEGKLDPQYIIRMSVHAMDPMGTAYHESVHALFAHLREMGNSDVMRVLTRAAEAAPVLNQLKKLLKDEPEALKQLENREERIAYMYQFYNKRDAGGNRMITLGSDTRSVITSIKNFVYKVMGMWTNDERAQHIMDYFSSGEFAKNIGDRNAVSRATMDVNTNRGVEYAKRGLEPFMQLYKSVWSTGAARLRDTNLPSLMRLADHIQPSHVGNAEDPGFIQSVHNERTVRMNAWAKGIKDISADDIYAAGEHLRRGTDGDGADQMRVVKATREHLAGMLDYMKKAGVDVGTLGGKYFPRVWDAEYISKNQDAFKTMMAKYEQNQTFKGNTQDVMNKLMARDGVEQGVVVDMPGMQHIKERKLDFITPDDAAPFLQKNLFQTINSYTVQAARRAEWAKRFGDDGKGMRDLLAKAKADGATNHEINAAQDFIRGIDGTLGDDINPTARRLFGNMIVYQNIRLLPLAIFSSLIDPGGIMVRGGTISDAFKAFKAGVMEIPRGFKKNADMDERYKFAQDMGTIDDTTLVHSLGSAYTQGMVAEGARKWNDAFFKYNLMEQYNTSMRVSAAQAAKGFLKRHADGTASEHSTRWLAELGYKPGEIITKDGEVLTRQSEFMAHGMKEEEAAAASNKMRGAINRWVDGAILRPNAADKPIWMNDPHWALVAHLKQFTYAFQNTILKRAWTEAEYGNYGPALALSSYVPMMMAADFVKGMIQGGGQQPEWKQSWGASDYLGQATQRAGLLGVGQYSSDAIKDIRHGGAGINTFIGPAGEQAIDLVKTLAGHEMFKTFGMRALPANTLFAHMFDVSGTDPNFGD